MEGRSRRVARLNVVDLLAASPCHGATSSMDPIRPWRATWKRGRRVRRRSGLRRDHRSARPPTDSAMALYSRALAESHRQGAVRDSCVDDRRMEQRIDGWPPCTWRIIVFERCAPATVLGERERRRHANDPRTPRLILVKDETERVIEATLDNSRTVKRHMKRTGDRLADAHAVRANDPQPRSFALFRHYLKCRIGVISAAAECRISGHESQRRSEVRQRWAEVARGCR